MRWNFSEIFSNNTGGVTVEIGGKMVELQFKMANYDEKEQLSCNEKWSNLVGKIAELQQKMFEFRGENSGVAAEIGQKQWKF